MRDLILGLGLLRRLFFRTYDFLVNFSLGDGPKAGNSFRFTYKTNIMIWLYRADGVPELGHREGTNRHSKLIAEVWGV